MNIPKKITQNIKHLENSSRPFLKWPGGKYRLVDRISKALGPGKRLIEPFVGSAAIFLNTDYDRYILADTNNDLINLYSILEQQGDQFIDTLQPLFLPETNTPESYYQFRDEFNNSVDQEYKAALFIYLNRHCYNGLCRYNQSGKFNSPFGRYKKPQVPKAAMQAFHKKADKAKISSACFSKTMGQARKGDLVYCDPPYAPLSKTANFTNYSANGFDMDKQEALAKLAIKLSKKGVRVVISNHDTAEIRELYKDAEISEFEVPRFISQDIKNRGKAREILAIFKAQES